ncbi:peptide-methionine (S)-S-oxide reductase [Candidatus Uhrbacteria bacterium RIFCSPLOWO2_01_FULL_47_24]|uniref:Peptide methionine sulfoxide reductase MsrA n=1 Tax=Candidatus Uhrbacteria bacterium RIFCSPLOWO2_01_FULL_47_24 TaxID=1802401 RepID=A0A1F7UT19_9BACT|nr:MAG: peptide-methionine (S)-S-oxide reductase [Candidatus Uhrbacteria bacterium RIFCSPHIGHO2_01_FULL_47_11]OGL69061.1 MAG: peptide-methionine (S)-S-oxide reductase [Candidatus Uhrbacteria bacterium RIFCSPHIGHO2_02_FULL_46_47]OGL74620.1 MAG: peptide-methionine (S)-S-oxide reductase [Candidatus Uhrbacteria bacterium RIFCSPHIGHO2_12_FULL_47_11]OGL81431.1 MAG: peptide-methionine (S)-S-oxide reductase [Candidatus Uhrbacteria bacterium RIFCSPLOWO2_01_FULL_47_24]OGL83699.1 MAG: peptide-methionine (
MPQKNEIAVFGGGCFWCTEAIFKMLKGVVSVMPGYAGGPSTGVGNSVSYGQVSTGATGHAEAVRIEYDPTRISYETLLTVFFATHDPTSLNRQGADVGTQYRSTVLYTTDTQKRAAERMIQELNASTEQGKPIVTEVKPFEHFYEGENYHRDYYANNKDQSYCQIVINPKLEKVRKKFADLIKTS